MKAVHGKASGNRDVPSLKRIEMVAFDVDGTVATKGDHISPYVLEALRAAKQQGLHLVISTGRPKSMLPDQLTLLADFAICSNGAKVYDLKNGRTIYSEYFPKTLVLELMKELGCQKVSFGLQIEEHPVMEAVGFLRCYGIACRELRSVFRAMGHMRVYLAADIVLSCKRIAAKSRDGTIEKLLITCANEKKMEEVGEFIKAHFALEVAASSKYDLEVTMQGIHKGKALSRLRDHLGLEKDQVIAVGDSGNDVSMGTAAVFAAMGNAPDHVKKEADMILPDVWSDGMAVILKNILDDRLDR